MTKTRRRSPVPPAKPRQPLTAKREGAIFKYVKVKTAKFPVFHEAIRRTLEAERMPAEKLYGWLETKGYKWNSRVKMWM